MYCVTQENIPYSDCCVSVRFNLHQTLADYRFPCALLTIGSIILVNWPLWDTSLSLVGGIRHLRDQNRVSTSHLRLHHLKN